MSGGPDLNAQEAVDRICRFCTGVLDAIAPHVPCVKIQSACFERYLWPGVEAYHRIVAEARAFGLLVIGDAKRGDIGVSADHYAAGLLADSNLTGLGKLCGSDALTINSYLGADGIEPFIDVGRKQAKGLFALVRTSNPGGDAIQALRLKDGRTVGQAMAQLIADLGSGDGLVGDSGYSLLGAVVGATKPAEAAELRRLMPQQLFLVPGFGAQGAGADDVKACFDARGEGALITASRSIIYAFNEGGDWRKAIADAAVEMKEQIAAITA